MRNPKILSPRPRNEGEGQGEGAHRIQFARNLRKNQTDAERKLWALLRGRDFEGFKFRRQHDVGPYIVDFCCAREGIIVELDGGQHQSQKLKDEKRTDYLTNKGYKVLRFWNSEVFENTGGVLEIIRRALVDPHPSPLPGRERGKEG